MERRAFIKGSALAMFGAGRAPMWLARAATAPAKGRKVLVAVFQRGAADGLNMVVPFGEQLYYDLRPGIAIPRPSQENGALDLNGFLGLHPALAPLKPLFDRKELAIVEAVGSPDATRSHFDAQDYMESGTPGIKATRSGWMNRSLGQEEPVSPLRAVSMGAALPKVLRGTNPAVAVRDLRDFGVKDQSANLALNGMYTRSADARLEGAGKATFEAADIIASLLKEPYSPAPGAEYPPGRFGESLRQIARLIKAGVGLEVAFTDIGGWDHHVNEVGARALQGPLANLLKEFGAGIAAFHADLGEQTEQVVLVTMSEFGRTVRENGSRGTDHGHANVMFVLGGKVRGGEVYGRWPGLAADRLYEGRDLAVTTDFRDVLGALVKEYPGNSDLSSVFPGYAPVGRNLRGILS